jgi:hypothetical protein
MTYYVIQFKDGSYYSKEYCRDLSTHDLNDAIIFNNESMAHTYADLHPENRKIKKLNITLEDI